VPNEGKERIWRKPNNQYREYQSNPGGERRNNCVGYVTQVRRPAPARMKLLRRIILIKE